MLNAFRIFRRTGLRFASTVLKDQMANSTCVRENPAVTKVSSSQFKSIFSEELYDLIGVFKKYNYELRIAGGAVRDVLMDITPKDIDLATTATPEQMKEMFNIEGIRLINMKGEKHGTITPRINDKENFEVTTLRIDKVTDGRHAEVEFTTDWQLDANRRDLTINSMFLAFDGTVYDYFYGYEDIKKRRVVFVGQPDARIKEDYLRILRYFRFYGRIAENSNNHDDVTLKAIADNIDGLKNISGERIWGELKKTLQGNFALELTIAMLNSGIAPYVGLPKNPNVDELKKVFANKQLNSITYMTALLHCADDAIKLHERLKLSAFERDLAYFISQNRHLVDTDLQTLHDYKKLCLQPFARKDYVEELLMYFGKVDIYNELKDWKIPSFPINGNMLKERNCPGGKLLGRVMSQLKLVWADSDFKITTEQLLNNHLPEILERITLELKQSMNKKQKTK